LEACVQLAFTGNAGGYRPSYSNRYSQRASYNNLYPSPNSRRYQDTDTDGHRNSDAEGCDRSYSTTQRSIGRHLDAPGG
jgi:hypothetical protein